MAGRSRHSLEFINRKIEEASVLLADGMDVQNIAKKIDVAPATLRRWLKDANVKHPARPRFAGTSLPHIPESKEVKPGRYLATTAQNNSSYSRKFLRNLLAYAEHAGAELIIGGNAYARSNFRGEEVKDGRALDKEPFKYHDDLMPYMRNEVIRLSHDLVIANDMQVIATAVNPLEGLDEFPPHSSSVIPHQKVAMTSVPGLDDDRPLFRYTTGAVTDSNLIPRKAGQRASFHHAYGAMMIEVGEDGVWHARQVIANSKDGSFQDLDALVKDGVVTRGNRIEALVCGDTHVAHLDATVDDATFGAGGIVETLDPRHIILHDCFDGRSVNHYTMRNFVQRIREREIGELSISNELDKTAAWLIRVADERNGHRRVAVVQSNHDNRIERMVNEFDWRQLQDLDDMHAYLRTAEEYIRQVRVDPNRAPIPLAVAMRSYGMPTNVTFLGAGKSMRVAGIEVGMHGDVGANGSRGSVRQFAKYGMKAVVGHSHVASIHGGTYSVGASCDLNQEYAKRGMSAWSHTHCVVYPSGKRALVNIKPDGAWRL